MVREVGEVLAYLRAENEDVLMLQHLTQVGGIDWAADGFHGRHARSYRLLDVVAVTHNRARQTRPVCAV
jgi:hypothetical protein